MRTKKPTANPPESLATRLRARREQKGLTQAHLGELAGTNQGVIQKIENGKSLQPRKIEAIAQVLEVDPAWLMFGTNYTLKDRDQTLQALLSLWPGLTRQQQQKLLTQAQAFGFQL